MVVDWILSLRLSLSLLALARPPLHPIQSNPSSLDLPTPTTPEPARTGHGSPPPLARFFRRLRSLKPYHPSQEQISGSGAWKWGLPDRDSSLPPSQFSFFLTPLSRLLREGDKCLGTWPPPPTPAWPCPSIRFRTKGEGSPPPPIPTTTWSASWGAPTLTPVLIPIPPSCLDHHLLLLRLRAPALPPSCPLLLSPTLPHFHPLRSTSSSLVRLPIGPPMRSQR